MQLCMNVYGFINGSEKMVFAAHSYEDAMQMAFENCENTHGFISYNPSQEEINMVMSLAHYGTIH